MSRQGPCKAWLIPCEPPCQAVSLGQPFLWRARGKGEDEAMAGEKLRLKKGDASGTKLPSDAGTNQHSNPSAEGRARWSNTKNVSNRRLNVGKVEQY